MSPGAIAAIIVAVALVVLIISAMTVARRRKLRQRFGPEYDRVADQLQSQRKADAELASRERRVRSLDIRPLDEAARAKYAAGWTTIQQQFVDQPQQAVTQAGLLVASVMKERGYPAGDHDQVLADLSVEHASTLDHYRVAHQLSQSAEAGTASTEDLRLAMLHYRSLFADLLGEPAGARAAQAGAEAADVEQARAASTAAAGAPVADPPPVQAPVAGEPGGTGPGAGPDDPDYQPAVPAPRRRPSADG